MKIESNRNGSGRLFRSRAKSLVGAGAASALVIASLALIGVLPASAAGSLAFAGVPTTAVAGQSLATFTVTTSGTGGTADSITISSPTCTLTGTTTQIAVGSVATFSGIAITTATSGTCTLNANDTTATVQQASGSITVAPAAASKLGFTPAPPSTFPANSNLTTFKVSTEDQYNNPTGSGTDTIALTSSCPLGGTVSAPETAGVATFSLVTINASGSCYLVASDTSNGGIAPVTSGLLTVTAGAATKVVFTTAPPASSLTVGAALATFAVSVEDVNGNVEKTGTGSADSITISSPCTLGGTTTEPAVAGVATFPNVTVTVPGSCVLTATDATRNLVTATATTSVGEAQAPLVLTTKTAYLDAPLTLATSGGTGAGAVTYTVTNGTATFCAITNGTLTAKTAGTCLVIATKAAAAPYRGASSTATTVTISSAPKALKVVGSIINGRKTTVTVTGYNFAGRPKVISNVAGFKATVSRDSGKSLSVVVTVTGKSAPGVKVMTIILANGKRASVKYSLRG